MVEPASNTINLQESDLPNIALSHAENDVVPGASEPGQQYSVRSGYAYEIGNTDTFKRITELEAAIGANPLEGLDKKRVYFALKRGVDIVFSLGVLALFWWLYLIVALLIKIDDPKGPIIFKQTRVGKNGAPFTMYKFRSMCVDAEERLGELKDLNEKTGPVFKIADDPRVTKIGRWLRKLSLDELPQFVNVLKGDISVVGPRPALPNEVATYTPYQRQRLAVKPGITCYWQTRRNRDSITFEEWLDLDLLYIKNCNAWADTKLIIQTVGVVMTAQGS